MSASRIAAAGFLAFAAALAAGSWALPEGVGAVPGPAFFPLAISAAMAALALALLLQRETAPMAPPALEGSRSRLAAGVIALLSVYLLLWGTGLFALRTLLFLTLLLRGTGQSWRTGVGVAAALTAVVVAAFQMGLRVSLE